ncbi:hypothetical protein TNCV_1066111 [Trichonephila clavipes]|nr:hypothetical protein TNCV_1066111 [Trichonephila clavipes]
MPAYNFHDPALWFTMSQAAQNSGFQPVRGSNQTAKQEFSRIIAFLPQEAATIVHDVKNAMNPTCGPCEKRNGLIKAVNHPIKGNRNYSSEKNSEIDVNELLRVMRSARNLMAFRMTSCLELFSSITPFHSWHDPFLAL